VYPDPHKIERKFPHPHQSDKVDPHPHQSDELYPDSDPHQFADDKLKCMEYEPRVFEHFLKVLSLYLEARIRIWIRIRLKGRS
jgi:hypothetical protein